MEPEQRTNTGAKQSRRISKNVEQPTALPQISTSVNYKSPIVERKSARRRYLVYGSLLGGSIAFVAMVSVIGLFVSRGSHQPSPATPDESPIARTDEVDASQFAFGKSADAASRRSSRVPMVTGTGVEWVGTLDDIKPGADGEPTLHFFVQFDEPFTDARSFEAIVDDPQFSWQVLDYATTFGQNEGNEPEINGGNGDKVRVVGTMLPRTARSGSLPQVAFVALPVDGVTKLYARKIEASGAFWAPVEVAPQQSGIVGIGPVFTADGT
jgi:hypothetical protein